MTKAAALHTFYSSFTIPAYEENSVPDGAALPYLTYNVVTDSFSADREEVSLSCSLWYRSESWVAINAKAEEISSYIGRGGVKLTCDGGQIWLKRGQPFANSAVDDTEPSVKRKLINISAEFLTIN